MSAGGQRRFLESSEDRSGGRGAPDLHPTPGYPHPGPLLGLLGLSQGRGAFRGGEDALLLQGRPPQPLGRGRLPAVTPEGWDESGEGWPAVGTGGKNMAPASAEWMESQQDELGARGRVFCSLETPLLGQPVLVLGAQETNEVLLELRPKTGTEAACSRPQAAQGAIRALPDGGRWGGVGGGLWVWRPLCKTWRCLLPGEALAGTLSPRGKPSLALIFHSRSLSKQD